MTPPKRDRRGRRDDDTPNDSTDDACVALGSMTTKLTIAERAVLVTWANRGIGQALVEEALRRGVKRVYAGTREPLAHSDRRVTPLTLDVTNAVQTQAAVERVESLDMLVNNAGVALKAARPTSSGRSPTNRPTSPSCAIGDGRPRTMRTGSPISSSPPCCPDEAPDATRPNTPALHEG